MRFEVTCFEIFHNTAEASTALDRRMRYFNIFYHSNNVSLNAVKEAVKGDLNVPGELLGYRAMHLKIRQKNGLNVTRDQR